MLKVILATILIFVVTTLLFLLWVLFISRNEKHLTQNSWVEEKDTWDDNHAHTEGEI